MNHLSRDQLLDAAEGRDNSITSLAPAYRLDPGAGWDVPPALPLPPVPRGGVLLHDHQRG